MEDFFTDSKSEPIIDRTLATVLISDIVDSTGQASDMGDRRWQDLMAAHKPIMRTEQERFRGNEVRFTGDGFDGPARAIRCAMANNRNIAPLGIAVRIGLHASEVVFGNEEGQGIAVNTAARVSALAGASEILVSRIVKDLVAGSGTQLSH